MSEKSILDPTPRDHAAHALARQIIALTRAADREITDFSSRGDYRGATAREDMWREEVLEACLTANAHNHTVIQSIRQELVAVLEDMPLARVQLVREPLPPASTEGRADGVGGPNPADSFKDALVRITNLQNDMSLTSAGIGYRSVGIARAALDLRQRETDQAKDPAGAQ